jgi:serine/threonine-protein kinase HipA
MRMAQIYVQDVMAGHLIEQEEGQYCVEYRADYQGMPISLTMPLNVRTYQFKTFPSFFEGLLPEGPQLEGLLKYAKLDRSDYFGQLMMVGRNLVGAVNVLELPRS